MRRLRLLTIGLAFVIVLNVEGLPFNSYARLIDESLFCAALCGFVFFAHAVTLILLGLEECGPLSARGKYR
jgi:hypothetical protein